MSPSDCRACCFGIVLLAACGDGSEPSDLPGNPAVLELVSGDGQLVAPGDTTAVPLAVRVLDSAGRPVPEVEVTFSVRAGVGNLVHGSEHRTLSIATTTDGTAEARWAAGVLASVPDSAYIEVEAAALPPLELLVRIGFPPPPVGRSIAAASNFTCRITNPLHCWGTLQDGLPLTYYTGTAPVTVDGFGGTMCAAIARGRYCWGDNSTGQYGNGLTTSYPEPYLIEDGFQFLALAIGGDRGCGLDLNASMWCWRKLSSPGGPTTTGYPQLTGTGIVRIDAGADFVCSVSAKRAIECAGGNAYGQLGSTGGAAVPFADVTTGSYHACGLANDGVAWCWGRNDAGQLGDGSGADRNARLPVSGSLRFSELSAGDRHTCGLTADGRAWCWGSNSNGQLGNESFDDSATPVAVAGPLRFTSVAAGARHTCGILADGRQACWGATDRGQVPVGLGLQTPWKFPIAGFDTIWAGSPGYCARTAGAHTHCWGGWGGSTEIRHVPQADALQSFSWAVETNCGLASDGTAWCWGENGEGQLGNGSTGGSHSTPLPVVGGHQFSKVAPAATHACGLTTTGRVWCWGSNSWGQLGVGAGVPASPVPLEVSGGRTYTDIASGYYHTCALQAGGVAYCWGHNGAGQLGDGTLNERAVPTRVFGSQPFQAIRSFDRRTCALTAAGEAYCWGNGYAGTLGYSPNPNPCGGFLEICSSIPARILTDIRFEALAGDWANSCGIALNGETWCWGDYEGGARGGPFYGGNPIPPTIVESELQFESIDVRSGSACGLTASSEIYCWGRILEWPTIYDFSSGVTTPVRF